MRTVCVVTTSRADFGIYLPVLRQIEQHPGLGLDLLVSGAHLSPDFGMTVGEIEEQGFDTSQRVEMLLSSDTAEGVAKSMGLGMIGFAQAYARRRPDILLVLGDRFEMHAAATAALPFRIPIAHIHGGEASEGAIDDALRHSITKMSHLHFVATDEYRRRIIQMGESPARVITTGAPALDNLRHMQLLSREELEQKFNLQIDRPFVLVTYHPATLEDETGAEAIQPLLAALNELSCNAVFTYPNADAGSRGIIQAIQHYAGENSKAQIVVNLGAQAYFSMMSLAEAMIGNSSSGIIEAASVKLPVLNIGDRQRGRVRARNVVDVGQSRQDIVAGLRRVTDPAFRQQLADMTNPYGDGRAAERIARELAEVELGSELLKKRFYEVGSA